MAQILSGSRASFELAVNGGNKGKIGYAYGVDIDEEIAHEEVQPLDTLSVAEHVPVSYRVTMSAEIFKSIPSQGGESVQRNQGTALGNSGLGLSSSLKSQGFMPKVGKEDIAALRQATMTAKIFDNGPGGAQLGEVTGVRVTSNRFSIRARQIVAENVRFVCQRFQEYSELPGATSSGATVA